MASQALTFIKIGGSLITDKTKPCTIHKTNLQKICREIKSSIDSGKRLIVSHGAGSFGHIPAAKYQTYKGILNEESYKGFAVVADAASQLNKIVVASLLEVGVNAVAVSPRAFMLSENHVLKTIYSDSIEALLDNNLVPVVHGDQMADTKTGCTIFSAEKVLGYLALHLQKKGYRIEQMIHCSESNGVWNEKKEIIDVINSRNFNTYKSVLGGSKGVDVTGGMLHKVEETLFLAKQGIPGLIIDGIKNGHLADAVSGKKVIGTRIEA